MIPTQARFLFISPRNPYSHRSGILIHISPERLFTCSGIRKTGHWTTSADRCNRELGKRFGDNAYSIEELIAELTAAFTLAHLGLASEPRQDHSQYIASWLGVLKADKRAIFTAASKAQQACDYLLTCSGRSQEMAA